MAKTAPATLQQTTNVNDAGAILHIVNRSGGGTMRYIEALIHSPAMPYRQFVWYVGQHQHVLYDVKNNDYRAFSAQFSPAQQQSLVFNLIQDAGVSRLGLHLHSFSGNALSVAEHWTALPTTATFHDHHFLGEAPFVDGVLCVDEAHVKRVRVLLHDAEIIVPSQYLYRQALPYFDTERLHVIAHGSEPALDALDETTLAFVEKLKEQAHWEESRLTVATIGAIDDSKGLAMMKAWLAAENDTQFVCIGYTADFAADKIRPQATEKNIMHGFYHHAEVPALLRAYGVDVVVFFLGIAESFCYALSDIGGSVPALVPNRGALGERVTTEHLGDSYPENLPVSELSQQIQQTAKRIIDAPNFQTVETMTLKTAHYYQQQDIEDLLQKKLSLAEMSELLDDQLNTENLKWEMALLVRQHYDLTNNVGSLQAEVGNKDEALKAREAESEALEEALQQREEKLLALNNELQQRDDKVHKLSSSQQEQSSKLYELGDKLKKRDDKVQALENELHQRDVALLRDRETAKARELELERLQQTVYGAGAAIDAMKSTLSWRITRPLRRVRRSLKTETAEEGRRQISVVLPIYRNTTMTMDCIKSALPGILAVDGARLILVNDASPEADMQESLSRIATQYPDVVTLLSNAVNLGFVASVNRGMKAFPDTDIILLNSDVLLPDDTWLARLAEDAYTTNDIASVTPLSNNTTICTFPEFLQDNPLPFGLTVSEVDRAFCGEKYDCVEAPTGVGFCMYIRRKALDVVGYFDEVAFGRGYGEENDFCQHAIRSGFRNVISPNLYVYHRGGASFGEDKQALIENASRVIDSRYPSYHSDVQVFIGKDPLRAGRVYRFAKLIADSHLPKILHISHGTGGGVGQHIEELNEALGNRAISLTLVPEGDKGIVKLSLAISDTADCLYFNFEEDYEELVALLQHLGVGLLHYHHTVRFGDNVFRLPDSLGVAHIFTLHDFYLLGGNPTLSDETGIYPGHFDETLQNPMYPYPKHVTREQFRTQHRQLIESAKMVISPSQSTLDIFGEVYRLPSPQVVPHLESMRQQNTPIALAEQQTFTVGIFGAISREKGADLIEAMAAYAKRQKLPIKFVLIGYAYRSLKGVTATGPFEREQLVQKAKDSAIDVVFFSARWPETYSYTLSYALEAGLPIFAPALGAFPERLANRPLTAFFNHLDDAPTITAQLAQFIRKNKGKSADSWQVPNGEAATQFYLGGDYLADVSQPNTADEAFLPSKQINVGRKLSGNLSVNEKLVVRLWKVYTHPSMRWVNWLVPFRVRRGLKRLLSRQAIHDLVNKHETE